MLVKENLPEARLETISKQITGMLAGLLDKRASQPNSMQLRESFAIWTLNLRDLTDNPPKDAGLPALETGYWHHQILFDGKPKAHARSEVFPKRPARVREVAISPLAKKIDDAIEFVESPERDWASSDVVHVQLLALPSLLIYTFRLVEPKKVYLIDAFPEFISLKQGRLFDEGSFLASLYSDLQLQQKKHNVREKQTSTVRPPRRN